MIRWYWLSAERAVTCIVNARSPLSEPLRSVSPVLRSTGRLSPVSDDSSRLAASDSRVPSTGTTLGRFDQQDVADHHLVHRDICTGSSALEPVRALRRPSEQGGELPLRAPAA